LDNYYPLSISRLGLFSPTAAVRGSNYHNGDNNTHYKAGFVKIIRIVVKDTILNFNVIYKGKPLANNYWIFAFSPLVVVFTRKTRPEFWLAFNKVVSPSYTNRGRVAFA